MKLHIKRIEQYALPELEKLAAQPIFPELRRWQQLAEQIMPQIEDLAAQDPNPLCYNNHAQNCKHN